jgi:hypothetical protein
MTGFGGTGGAITTADGASIDAFARWRTSSPVAIFESQLGYDDQPLFWETFTAGAGSTLFLSDESSLELSCGTTNGDRVVRQTFQYFRYQPGKSQLILMTGVLGEAKTNVEKRIGYFDDEDGVFFEHDGYTLQVVLRSSASGSAVDTIVAQEDWNIDKFDGTGPSGIILDITKSQIFSIDFQWLGVGRVRYGFITDGVFYHCHEMNNANLLDTVYMSTPNLPLRYEIENVDTSASSTAIKQICASVVSEGGFEEDKGTDRSVANGITGQSITSRASVLAIRPKDTFNSIKNRGNIVPIDIEIFTETNSVFYEVILKGAVTGASWSSVDADSITESSITSGTVTGGTVIASGYALAGGPPGQSVGGGATSIRLKYALGSDFAGTAQDQLSVVCTSLTGTATVYASITFKERF